MSWVHNGVLRSAVDVEAGTYTEWDESGAVVEQRALTADELRDKAPPVNAKADALDALADIQEASDLATDREQAILNRQLAQLTREG